MHSTSNNIKFTPYSDANGVIDELFESLCSKYPENLEISMRESDFISDSVQLMCYKCHRVNFIHGGSYIDFPDQIKKKKATTNSKKTDDQRLQYPAYFALNYEETESSSERVLNIKAFINRYDRKGINYLTKIHDWKTFEKNNPEIVLDIFYAKVIKYVLLIFKNQFKL